MPIKFVQWSNYCDAFVAIYAPNDYTSLLRDDLAIDSTIYLSIYLSIIYDLSFYLSILYLLAGGRRDFGSVSDPPRHQGPRHHQPDVL